MGSSRNMVEGAVRLAIAGALKAIYPRGELVTFGEGVGVLAEVRVYLHPATDKDPEHWHYVTVGLSELDGQPSDLQEQNGWGFELTMRVAAPDGERELPEWPVLALAKLAAYVDESGRMLYEGDHVSFEGPFDKRAPSIVAVALARDPELGVIDTPSGPLTFLQAVGVTADEDDLLTRWSVKAYLDVLAKQTPLLLTRPERPSLLRDPVIGTMLEQRAASEGSSESIVMADTLTWQVGRWPGRKVRLSLGPADRMRRNLGPLLASRVSRGQPLKIRSGRRTVQIQAGQQADWEDKDDTLLLTVSAAMMAELEAFLGADNPSLESRALPGFVLVLVV
jgi:suppressor of fused